MFTGARIEPMSITIELETVPRVGELVLLGDGLRRHVKFVTHVYEDRVQDVAGDLHWDLAEVQGSFRGGSHEPGPIVRVELEMGLPRRER
jgi:hypothetical protein